jgi:RNA polymerase sigma-70 factor, ECF subfamily
VLDTLLNKSKEGDSKAFSDISGKVREISHSYFLSKYRLKKIFNVDDVDDLTNNVYLSFAEQYHSIESLENWLRRVLFLTFVKWYKTQKKRQTSQLYDNVEYDGGLEQTTDQFDVDAVLKILSTMSEEKQEIVRLRFWGDSKFSEIAEKLNKNEAAVKKMFYRTILEIKERLD